MMYIQYRDRNMLSEDFFIHMVHIFNINDNNIK